MNRPQSASPELSAGSPPPAPEQTVNTRHSSVLQSLSAGCLSLIVGVGTVSAAPFSLSDADRARCLAVLREGLAGDDFWPAMHAAEGLTTVGLTEEVRASLVPKLATERDAQRRCGLARELVRAGDQQQVAILVQVLQSPDPYGHTHACESLFKVHQLGAEESMKAAASQDQNAAKAIMACAALIRSGQRDWLPRLRGFAAASDETVSRTAAWVLGRVGDASDRDLLRAGVGRVREPLSRAYFQHALAALGDPEGAAALRNNLRHEDAAVRVYAAEFAPDAKAFTATDPLLQMLADAHLDARIRAAHALLSLEKLSRQ